MQRQPLTYKKALFFALGISIFLNMLFLVAFMYGKYFTMSRIEEPSPQHPRLDFDIIALHILLNFVIAFVLYVLNFKILKSKIYFKQKIFASIGFSIIVTICLSLLFYYLQMHFLVHNDGPQHFHFLISSLTRDFFIAIIVVFSSLIIYLSYQQQQTALENETLLSKNLRAHYEALKNQVNPHFLFNSLNTLNSLIKIDADKAQNYVQQLSSVFRYTLQNQEIITLKEEMDFTQSYCQLMQIRYGENLKFVQQIDEKYYSYKIMPLSLQILVENSIKHNVVSNKHPLTIIIKTTVEDNIIVSNPIQPKIKPEQGNGIGLVNLSERYRLMWKKEISIDKKNDMFEVTIPLIQA